MRPGAGVVVATGAGTLLLERVRLGRGDDETADRLAMRLGIAPGERLGAGEEMGREA